ncbi:ABC transporter ATP-binding protein [Flexivirga alba]|uniref:ABC transporter ATP-binding protein n=1 Tax=Flexivirga alba TaxID=702742 RepID=A0ABW2AJU3_9MICO
MTVLGLQPSGSRVSGSITFRGQDLLDLGAKHMNALRGKELAMVFQDPSSSFHPMLTIGQQMTDHVRHHLGLSRRAAQRRAVELLERVRVDSPQLAMKRYPHQFSGGQLQRVAIAGAIACEPAILVADEPTTALDVTVQAGILALLRELCDSLGLTIILITHDFGVMSSLADNITVLREGKVVEHGARYQVIRHPNHPYTKELIESLPQQETPASGASVEPGGHDVG